MQFRLRAAATAIGGHEVHAGGTAYVYVVPASAIVEVRVDFAGDQAEPPTDPTYVDMGMQELVYDPLGRGFVIPVFGTYVRVNVHHTGTDTGVQVWGTIR